MYGVFGLRDQGDSNMIICRRHKVTVVITMKYTYNEPFMKAGVKCLQHQQYKYKYLCTLRSTSYVTIKAKGLCLKRVTSRLVVGTKALHGNLHGGTPKQKTVFQSCELDF